MSKEVKVNVNKEENGLVKIDKAIERVITIKIYIFMIIMMIVYSAYINNYTLVFLSCVLLYVIIKIKKKYKMELVDDKEYKHYLKLKNKYETKEE